MLIQFVLLVWWKAKKHIEFKEFLETQSRYLMLKNSLPDKFNKLSELSEDRSIEKQKFIKNISETKVE